MDCQNPTSPQGKSRLPLQQATRAAGHHQVCSRRSACCMGRGKYPLCKLGIAEMEKTALAAAQGPLRRLGQGDARHPAQKHVGSPGVGRIKAEMAGLVIKNPTILACPQPDIPRSRKDKRGKLAHPGTEQLRLLPPLRIVGKQLRVHGQMR